MKRTRNSQTKPARDAGERPASRRRSIRFLILFPVYVLAGFAVLLAPFAQPAVAGVTWFVTEASALLIRLFGGYASASGDLLVGSSSAHVIRVANGCNGLHVGVLLWAAIAAFPAPLAKKAKGFALSTAALYATNLVRVVSLFYLEPHGGAWFDLVHLYLWESLIVLGAFTVFWLWARSAYPAVSEARRSNG